MARSSTTLVRTLALVGFGIVGLMLVGASLVLSGPNDEQRTSADDAADTLDLLQIRVELARTHRDALLQRLLEPMMDITVDPNAPDLDQQVEQTLADLKTLSGSTNSAGFAAASLHATLTEWTAIPSEPVDELWDLMFFSDMARFEGSPPSAAEGFEQLLFYDHDVAEVLGEMAALQINERDVSDPALLEMTMAISPEFFVHDLIADGTDPNEIFVYGWQLDPEPDAAALHTELASMISGTPMADYNNHLARIAEGERVHTAPEFNAYADAMLALSQDLRNRLDMELSTQLETLATQEKDVASREQTLLIFRVAGIAISALALLAGVILLIIRARNAAKEVLIDPLTGVGNRRALDEHTARHMTNTDHIFHVVAVIDLDRFKLVNDGHGHATGDELLRATARGLQQVANNSAADAAAVIRQGGDEFLISMHSSNALDLRQIRRSLDQLRATSLTVQTGITIPLAFSYGLIADTGSPDLVSMIRSADLAAYEDKALRESMSEPTIDSLSTNQDEPTAA